MRRHETRFAAYLLRPLGADGRAPLRSCTFFFLMIRRPPRPPLFPYPPLFRSARAPLAHSLARVADASRHHCQHTPVRRSANIVRSKPLFGLCLQPIFAWQERDERTSRDRKSTLLNSSHSQISYAVFCLKKKTE